MNNDQVFSNSQKTVASNLTLAIQQATVIIHTSPGGGKTAMCQLLVGRAISPVTVAGEMSQLATALLQCANNQCRFAVAGINL